MLYIMGVGGEVGTGTLIYVDFGRCGYMGVLLFYIMSVLI